MPDDLHGGRSDATRGTVDEDVLTFVDLRCTDERQGVMGALGGHGGLLEGRVVRHHRDRSTFGHRESRILLPASWRF